MTPTEIAKFVELRMAEGYQIKDSGARQEFNTGAVRDIQEGKGRFDLLPTRALRRLAKHFEKGAAKYAARNWEKGMPLSRFLDSALRHTMAYMEGSDDEDHIVAAAWNLMCALDTESRCLEGKLPEILLDIGPLQVPAPEGPVEPGPQTELPASAAFQSVDTAALNC